jgi:DNA gyrase inhibitor GyrI
MNQAQFRVVTLAPCRVAAAHGFGAGPEGIAWDKLLKWMAARGLPVARAKFLGFNNPDPSPGSPEYGYEQWLVLEPAAAAGLEAATPPDAGLSFKDFPGGRYAALTHRGRPDDLWRSWGALVEAVERSPERMAQRQCLEDLLTPEILAGPGEPDWGKCVFDLYLAIEG